MFLASLAAAAAFFVLPIVGLVILAFQMPYLNPDGTPDNAPLRGAFAFVFFSPVLFALLASFGFGVTLALRRIQKLTPKALLTVVVTAGLTIGLFAAQERRFGWPDVLITFVAFFLLTVAALGLSSWVWWKIAMRPNTTVEWDGPLK
jgi:hypothetical protein